MSYEYLIGNTLVDMPRIKILEKLAQDVVLGAVAEVGVYRGGTARLLCENTTNKNVLLFDTFEGMPEVSAFDLHHKGDFADTSMEHIKSVLSPCINYVITKGKFPESAPEGLKSVWFGLVHLDVDIYQSVKECLEFFYPRMIPGGVIVLDDYNEPNCPGAKKAADEFMLDKPEGVVIPTVQSQAIIYKVQLAIL